MPPPLIFLGMLMAGLAIDRHLHDFGLPQAFAVVLLVGALVMIGAALRLFQWRQTRFAPWQPASALVTDGIYRFTRNPMYLGMTITALAVAIFCQSFGGVALTLVAAVLIDRLVILREEKYLLCHFGDPYATYMQQVQRWL